MSERKERRPPSALVLVGGLVLLHLLMAVRFPWEPGAQGLDWSQLSPDLVFLLALGFLSVLYLGERRLVAHAVAIGLVLALTYRFGSTAMPALYGTELNLYTDVTYLPSLWHLLLHEHPPWLQAVLVSATVVVLGLLYLALYVVVRTVLRAGGERRLTFGFAGAAVVLGLVGWAEHSVSESEESLAWSDGMLLPFAADLYGVIDEIETQRRYAEALVTLEANAADLPGDLGALGGADVYVYFIESYGRVLLEKPATRASFEAWAAEWDAELAVDGVLARSGFVYPRIRGGASSLAHAALLAGVPILNKRQFDLLLQSSIEPMPRFFREAGYRTLNVQPMMPEPWPEGAAFYGFTEEHFRKDLPYEGYRYHWGGMPDQFALAYLLREVIEPSETPLFVMFVSVSSHAPFRAIPPYFEDWDEALRPGAYAGEPPYSYAIDWSTYVGHPDAEEGYVRAIRYSMDTATAFARQLTRPSLVIVLGDHQPPLVGDLNDYDESLDVPIHFLANRPELMAPFEFMAEGVLPDDRLPTQPTPNFLRYFLESFSTER